MKSSKNTVSIVIPNLNGEELLKKNFPKIFELGKNSKNSIIEIIIVDDGSTDGSVKYIKENFPTVKIIKHKFNRGVASALNTGVRTAQGNLILSISTDMEPGNNIIKFLLPQFDDPKVFGVSFGEKGIGPEKGLWKDGFVETKFDKDAKEAKRNFYVRKAEGIFRRSIWIELGGMDEKLFLPFYWEDLDISYRAAKRGYHTMWEPKAEVTHDHWGTMGKFSKKFIANTGELHMLFFIWKNIHSASMFRRHTAALFVRLIKNPGYLINVVTALKKLNIVLKERKKQIKESKVSDEAIFSRFAK